MRAAPLAITFGFGHFWVQVPTVSASANTVIYMWYDNPDISTTQSNATGTWDSNYQAVWHMADNAASTTIVDSTTQNNGTMVGGNTSSYTTDRTFLQGAEFRYQQRDHEQLLQLYQQFHHRGVVQLCLYALRHL